MKNYVVEIDPEVCSRGGAFITIPNPRLKDGLNVFAIDDDEDDLGMVCDALDGNPKVKSIQTMTDSVQALHVIETGQFKPDLIFLDLNMPQVDGFKTLECIRAIPGMENTPVIILTTSGRIEDVRKSLRGTATSFIVKPDNIDELKTKTSEVIHSLVEGTYLEKRL